MNNRNYLYLYKESLLLRKIADSHFRKTFEVDNSWVTSQNILKIDSLVKKQETSLTNNGDGLTDD